MKRFRLFALFALICLLFSGMALVAAPVFPVEQVDFSPGFCVLPANVIMQNAIPQIENPLVIGMSSAIVGQLLNISPAIEKRVIPTTNYATAQDRFNPGASRRWNTGEMLLS